MEKHGLIHYKIAKTCIFFLVFSPFPIMRTIANRQKPTINKNDESE